MEWDRSTAYFDGTLAPDATLEHLDEKLLTDFTQRLGSSSTLKALEARSLVTMKGEITVAAFLMFGKSPQLLFPAAHVRVLKYGSNERGAGANQTLLDGYDIRCDGTLAQQIQTASGLIDEAIPQRRALASSGRFESVPLIPRSVWLEGLVNAVVHRSYSIGGDHIRVEIFPNRIEIVSPGRFPATLNTTAPESIQRHARNPRIARTCADLDITQELGEGLRRMFHDMNSAGLAAPVYTQTPQSVRLTLFSSNALTSKTLDEIGPTGAQILDVLRLASRPLGTGEISEATGLARPTALRYLKALREAQLVIWSGNSSTDPRATWALP